MLDREARRLLDDIDNAERELKIAKRNLKFSICSEIVSITSVAFSIGILSVVTNDFAIAMAVVATVIGLLAVCGSTMSIGMNLGNTGITKWEGSLPHKLHRAQRRYEEHILEEEAPPKQEVAVTPTKLITGKINTTGIIVSDSPFPTDQMVRWACPNCREEVASDDSATAMAWRDEHIKRGCWNP